MSNFGVRKLEPTDKEWNELKNNLLEKDFEEAKTKQTDRRQLSEICRFGCRLDQSRQRNKIRNLTRCI